MFESAELGHLVDDATFAKEERKLRADLLGAQLELLERANLSVLVLVNGVDGAGKGETIHTFNEWLDPRHVRTRAFDEPSEDERLRPPMWRFWQALPPKGKIGIFFGSWYTAPIWKGVRGERTDGELMLDIERIREHERLLAHEGVLLVKLWFHLSKRAQRKRLQTLEKSKLTRWRVTKADWKNHRRYDAFARIDELVLRETSTGEAPWVVIDGSDANYRSLTAGRTLLAAMRDRLDAPATPVKKVAAKSTPRSASLGGVDTSAILRELPFEARLSKAKYDTKIVRLQERLARLSRSAKLRRRGVAIVFEGMDAAGKGGAIRRVTGALDARQYNVIPIAAPTDEERAQPYLWRFWRHVPRRGQFVLYDRSWYGRVLVERVEGFSPEAAWTRAYHEITEFEEQLSEHGVVVVKFWLAITKDEQMRRFKERESTPYKQFKITKEDWRNRRKWDDYVVAASDMIDRTSTSIAPWTIVEANDKHLARVQVIETICERLAEAR
jgi:polyphosphate:AMP phosphotransferase